MILTALFFVLLFVFKDKINSFASKAIQSQAGPEIQNSGSALIDSMYNYSKNGLGYELTFLEFGSKGCSACKRMESVMRGIQAKYPYRVNVIFINILKPENQRLMKYFGIAAIPTQVLLNIAGQEYFRHTGFLSIEELEPELFNK